MSKGAAFTVSMLAMFVSMVCVGLNEWHLALYILGLAIWVKPTYSEVDREGKP